MNSLSAIKEVPEQPHQHEFNFEGYDEELLPEDSFAMAETLTLNAITSASDFTDLFEDARYISRIYGKNVEDCGLYYIFHAHDAVTGRNIAVKAINPFLCQQHPHLEDCLKWESKVLQKLKGKHRMQQILTPCKTMQTNIQTGRKKLYCACFILFFYEFLKNLHKNYPHGKHTIQVINNIVFTSLELGEPIPKNILNDFIPTIPLHPCNTATYGLYLIKTKHHIERGLSYYDRAIAMAQKDSKSADLTEELKTKKEIETAKYLIQTGDFNSARKLLERLNKRSGKTPQGYPQTIARLLSEC